MKILGTIFIMYVLTVYGSIFDSRGSFIRKLGIVINVIITIILALFFWAMPI